jgi:hypothetical protein
MATADYISGKPVMVDYTTTGNGYAAGDVIVVGACPFVAHAPNPQFAGGTLQDALAARGGIYRMTAAGAMGVGTDAFYDATNKKITAVAAGNTHFGTVVAGPTGQLSGAGPAADGNAAFVLHDPRGVPPAVLPGVRAEVALDTAVTVTPAQVLGGFIRTSPAGAINLTLPTAALLVAALPGAKVGDTVEFMVSNTAGGANAATLVAGSGGTLRGPVAVPQNKTAIVRLTLTNVTAASEAYTGYSVISA